MTTTGEPRRAVEREMEAAFGDLVAGRIDEDEFARRMTATTDGLRAPDTDIEVEPYEADPFPVSWDFLAAVVIAGACVAFGWWAFLR